MWVATLEGIWVQCSKGTLDTISVRWMRKRGFLDCSPSLVPPVLKSGLNVLSTKALVVAKKVVVGHYSSGINPGGDSNSCGSLRLYGG
jgi:hypothetical protein